MQWCTNSFSLHTGKAIFVPADSKPKAKDVRVRGETKLRTALHRWLQRLLRTQRGALLMEAVVALAVFGVLGTTVLGAVQTSFIGKRLFDQQSTVENLIRNQMESVFEQV